jgi:imidazoleglycerol-phosphate dehydratase
MNDQIRINRETRESKIIVSIDRKERREFSIDTSIQFLNHMIETLAWRACMNIDASFTAKNFRLTHVICEDTGIALGKAIAELAQKNICDGINGAGFSIMAIDEAMAIACISIEGRANCFIERQCDGSRLERVEDMLSADLVAFLEGLSQGMQATIRINMINGADPHHSWEAAFRALGCALKETFEKNEWRKGVIAGVKGTLD